MARESTDRVVPAAATTPVVLQLDTHTRNDLQLFTTDPDAPSLFKHCNRCTTDGGAQALRSRMDTPWATREPIARTQTAIRFLLAEPALLETLPAAHLINSVQRYSREILPVIHARNPLEFLFSAMGLWTQEKRFYSRISRGVTFTARLLQAAREFLKPLRTVSNAGDLSILTQEMAQLIDQDLLPALADDDGGRWFWRRLRADQTFRLTHRQALERLLELLYEVDALIAMARVSGEPGYCLPEVLDGPVRVNAEALRHPLLPVAVANPLAVGPEERVLLLTGPNMAGKTTYLRAAATALYFAHLGMGVPAQRFEFVPVQHLLTAISLNDDLLDGISYFRAEALRVKAVAAAIADGARIVAIMDEPFKGTNVKDAYDASLAVLQRFALSDRGLFMVSSHLIELGEALTPNKHFAFRYFEANEAGDRLRFSYEVRDGLSSQRLGMRVLFEEGIFDLLPS